MTNKINGIDVIECKYFNKVVNEEPYCNIDEEHLYTCSSDENCYFKQFKRLQKENEGLKSLNDFNVQKIEVLQEENEKLKKLKKYYKGFVANCRYCDEWYMDKCNYIKKENKYKQALEEIREIAKYSIMHNSELNLNYQIILQKINEVLNDRD